MKKAVEQETTSSNKKDVELTEIIDERTHFANKYKRDQFGLISSVKYSFNEDGSINWREMIKPEFLYPNKGWFESRGQAVPNSIEGLNDKQLLIMLGGLKELAKLRGFHSVDFAVKQVRENYVTAKCTIDWIQNFESLHPLEYCGDVRYADYANATAENTDSFCIKFLETIACNRAFVRCVRNFLNIHIVGADEIDKSNNQSPNASYESDNDLTVLKPSGLLEKTALNNKINSFEEFVEWLRSKWASGDYRNEEAKNWKSYKDIPAKECRKLISILEKN